MKVVFPVEEFHGAESVLYGHFGSAPEFAVMDTESGHLEVLSNGNREHAHGACNPLQAIGEGKVDAIVVAGIGPGALNGLRRAGIRVYKTDAATIGQAVEGLKDGSLLEFAPSDVCGGHGAGGCGCSHSR